jgi:uncharacterized repeat protein (TIGR04138 family)
MAHKPDKPLEQIVREVGRYPIDAFVFVQECIGLAAEKVHGPMSANETEVARWMARHGVGPDELRRQWESGELPPDIVHAVRQHGGPDKMNRHVTGQQLCWAIRDTALERWGLMARGVLARWEVMTTEDFGRIVFALVDNGWLQKQPTDSIRDFDDVFSFDEAFDHNYRFSGK